MRGTTPKPARARVTVDSHRSLRQIEERLRSIRRTVSVHYLTAVLRLPLQLTRPFGFVRIAEQWLEVGCVAWPLLHIPRERVAAIRTDTLNAMRVRKVYVDINNGTPGSDTKLPPTVVIETRQLLPLVQELRQRSWQVTFWHS